MQLLSTYGPQHNGSAIWIKVLARRGNRVAAYAMKLARFFALRALDYLAVPQLHKVGQASVVVRKTLEKLSYSQRLSHYYLH